MDNITALSAAGSRLGVEAMPSRPERDMEEAREMMRRSTAKWREHGFEFDWDDVGFEGERKDVADYLDGLGWRSTGTPMSQLLSDNGLQGPPSDDSVSMADTIYYTSVLDK